MILLELAKVLPGFVTLYIHSEDHAWKFSAGELIKYSKTLKTATVIKAVPLSPYTMEIAVKLDGRN